MGTRIKGGGSLHFLMEKLNEKKAENTHFLQCKIVQIRNVMKMQKIVQVK